MIRKFIKIQGISVLYLIVIGSTFAFAQNPQQQLYLSQQFRLGERIIRIAEPGELVDSVNVWGDVGSAGRYLIPKGTSLPELLSYAYGPRTLRDAQTDIDWSKMRVEVNIQEHNQKEELQKIKKFRYRFEEPFPEGMYDFIVETDQTITVRVKRKPSFRDYLTVISPVISAIGTAVTAAVLLTR